MDVAKVDGPCLVMDHQGVNYLHTTLALHHDTGLHGWWIVIPPNLQAIEQALYDLRRKQLMAILKQRIDEEIEGA